MAGPQLHGSNVVIADMDAFLSRHAEIKARLALERAASSPKWHKSQGGPGFYLAVVMEEEPRIGAYELEITDELLQHAPDSFLRWMAERTYGAPRLAATIEFGRRMVDRLSAE
jgi:hypothetical protein